MIDMYKSPEKNFGYLFAILFLVIGLWPLLNLNELRIWALLVALTLVFITLYKTSILKPLNIFWIKLGSFLGKIISPLVMLAVYFLVLTPVSLIVRLFGKDLLNLKFSNKVNSYWIKRKKEPGSMNRQF